MLISYFELENNTHLDVLPPINFSDLEMSECKPFGEGELEFNQNTVPFDFDGNRLMWLTYRDQKVRELSIFHFPEAKTESVHSFSPSDGMVSHLKFLKSEQG